MKHEKFDVINTIYGKYILELNFFDKVKIYMWVLLVVYGVAHDDFKSEFLAEIYAFWNGTDIPYLVGGDFNILRHCEEKLNRPLYPTFLVSLTPVFTF